DSKNKFHVEGTGIRSLIANVKSHMHSNNYEIPNNLEALIEDQICMRQPADRCWYENKTGDQLAKAIHTVARGIDAAAASIGIKSGFQQRARGCSRCGQRRVRMNS